MQIIAKFKSLNLNRTLLALIGELFLIFTTAKLIENSSSAFIYLLAAFVCATRIHALGILMHEGVHYHLSSHTELNDLLSNCLAGYFLILPVDKYRIYHFSHHHHPFSKSDLEWVHKSKEGSWIFPMSPLQFMKFLLLGPIYQWKLLPLRFKAYFYELKTKKSCQLFTVLFIITSAIYPKAFFICWLFPILFITPIITRIRSLAEHYPIEPNLNPQLMARDFRPPLIEKVFFFPYNITFHKSHHLKPQITFFQLVPDQNDLSRIKNFFGFKNNSLLHYLIK